ncbi:MAG TPA: hypothetical protein VIG97_03465 [Luteimonas sp.]
MSDNVKVTTLKGFNNGDEYAPRNTVITVTEQRARELERNGLVTREEKRAPEPKNKKAPEPKNKAAAKAESKAG